MKTTITEKLNNWSFITVNCDNTAITFDRCIIQQIILPVTQYGPNYDIIRENEIAYGYD